MEGWEMRSYIFTDQERRRLRRWLDTGVEDQMTTHIFLNLRQNLTELVDDVKLLRLTTMRLREKGRLTGRARLTNMDPAPFDDPA
jgi:hypothetical protein